MQQEKLEKYLCEYNDLMKENDNIYRGLSKKFGLSECAFWILYTLREDKHTLTQSDICDILHEPKQTVNSALKLLEADGYITLSNGDDRRSKRIGFTQKGVNFVLKTIDKVSVAEQNAFLNLSEEELDSFIALFDKYTKALKEETQNIGEIK